MCKRLIIVLIVMGLLSVGCLSVDYRAQAEQLSDNMLIARYHDVVGQIEVMKLKIRTQPEPTSPYGESVQVMDFNKLSRLQTEKAYLLAEMRRRGLRP